MHGRRGGGGGGGGTAGTRPQRCSHNVTATPRITAALRHTPRVPGAPLLSRRQAARNCGLLWAAEKAWARTAAAAAARVPLRKVMTTEALAGGCPGISPPSSTLYPDAFMCPITQELMVDPVVDTEGNTYEREAITQWLASNCTSPVTRSLLVLADLTPNRALQHVIEAHRRQAEAMQRDQPSRAARSEPRWVPDAEADACMLCDAKFSFWVRRTHCRYCGWVVCKDCCPEEGQKLKLDRRIIPGDPDPPGVAQKVCTRCFEQAPAEMDERQRESDGARATAQVSLEQADEFLVRGLIILR